MIDTDKVYSQGVPVGFDSETARLTEILQNDGTKSRKDIPRFYSPTGIEPSTVWSQVQIRDGFGVPPKSIHID